MNISIDMALIIVAIVLVLPCVYLLVLTVAAIGKRRTFSRHSETPTPSARIAVIVPSHNEENMIGSTVTTLLQSQYPKDLFDVFVIADNCSDSTAMFARAAGATSWERFDDVNPGKGQALDWAIKGNKSMLENYDVIAILDADTLAHPRFLAEIDRSFQKKEIQAVQGYYGTSNIDDGWRPALSEAAFAVSHHMRPLGRNALGSTAGLKGNGMAFRSELLLETGWPAHSLVEDLEFTLLLLEKGIKVYYNPHARVAAEMVTKSDAATTQRMRWEGGRGQILRAYGPRLIRGIIKGNRLMSVEALCDLLFPPLVLFALPSLIATPCFLIAGMYFPALITACGLAFVAIYVSIALLHRRVPVVVWKSLFAVPIFILWKIPVYLKLASKGTGRTWNRTRRENESSPAAAAPRTSRYEETISSDDEISDELFDSWNQEGRKRQMRWERHMQRILFLKRSLDIVAGAAAIFILSPLLLVTAFLIWREDRGSIFFKQQRVGRYGVPFTMYKFRSMRVDAEQRRKELDEQNEHDIAVTFKIKKDPRITNIGRFIRKFSIDEMPQFFNVLKGDMSMVGPRPALASEVEMYESFQLRRLNAKPGISCLWQVKGRSDIDFEGQVRLDLEYIHSESFLHDIVILIKTVPAVILARGAY